MAKRGHKLPAVGYGVPIWRRAATSRATRSRASSRRCGARRAGRSWCSPCDLPLVTAELVRELARADAGGAPAVVATT